MTALADYLVLGLTHWKKTQPSIRRKKQENPGLNAQVTSCERHDPQSAVRRVRTGGWKEGCLGCWAREIIWSGSKEREAGGDNVGQPFPRMGSAGKQQEPQRPGLLQQEQGKKQCITSKEQSQSKQGTSVLNNTSTSTSAAPALISCHCFRKNSGSFGDCRDYC